MAYAIVRNIPKSYRVKHLRDFFAEYVENERLQCFHYRHRPEVHVHKDLNEHSGSSNQQQFCCVVLLKNEEERTDFIRHYHLKFWINEYGQEMSLRCFIFPLKSHQSLENTNEVLTSLDFRSMIELRPPSLMPQGNVGTPTRYFIEQIRLCKLPPRVITKLGIKAKKRIGKYSAVHLNYSVCQKGQDEGESSIISRNFCSSQTTDQSDVCDSNIENEPVNDEVHCEEWERHESLHNDVTEQERTKPRKYEEEQEVTWEKGGPGLVWYMDNFFWKELEEGTDSDWKWADDWDVDYSIYYDRRDGDLDAKQAVEIIEDQKLRSGEISGSVFKKKEMRKRKHKIAEKPSSVVDFGQFEAHTRGIGSKIMRRYGWSPGAGLGASNSGRPEAVAVDIVEIGGGQIMGERKGLGYRGEKLQRTGFVKRINHRIATKFDRTNVEEDSGTMSKVLRSEDPDTMKFR